jgi:hypothetical protein
MRANEKLLIRARLSLLESLSLQLGLTWKGLLLQKGLVMMCGPFLVVIKEGWGMMLLLVAFSFDGGPFTRK